VELAFLMNSGARCSGIGMSCIMRVVCWLSSCNSWLVGLAELIIWLVVGWPCLLIIKGNWWDGDDRWESARVRGFAHQHECSAHCQVGALMKANGWVKLGDVVEDNC